MAKQVYKGQEGKWVTINGAHVFIPDGKTLDDVYADMSDEAWDLEYTKSQYADQVISHFSYADFKYWYLDKETKQRIKPAKHAKQVLRNVLEHREICDKSIDAIILKGLDESVTELIVNDRGTNWFKRDYWTGARRIQIDIDGNDKNKILESLSHEIGHAIDCDEKHNYSSSTYKSKVYGVTMAEMLSYEMSENMTLDSLIDEADILLDLRSQVINQYKNGEIDTTEYKRAYFRYDEARVCLADMCQAFYGDKETSKQFGYLPHARKYFENNNENSATELFAELTADLFYDKEKRFYNIMKQYCPDTIKIYHEILEERKSKWNLEQNN